MIRSERDLRIEDFVVRLKNDHEEIRRRLWIIKLLLMKGDCELVRSRAGELQSFISSHFAVEESRTRDILTSLRGSAPSNNGLSLRTGLVLKELIQKHTLTWESFREVDFIVGLPMHEERLSRLIGFERPIADSLDFEETVVIPIIRESSGRKRIDYSRKRASDLEGPLPKSKASADDKKNEKLAGDKVSLYA